MNFILTIYIIYMSLYSNVQISDGIAKILYTFSRYFLYGIWFRNFVQNSKTS